MNQSVEQLLDALQTADLIPQSMGVPDRYLALEQAVVEHCLDNEHPRAVAFDFDAIVSDLDYARLCSQFIAAIPSDLKITNIKSFNDLKNNRAGCAAKKRGKLIEADWEQFGDVVTGEFIAFIKKLINNKQGRFFEVDTGGQIYMAIFMDMDLHKALEAYRSQAQKSRNEFLTGESDQAKHTKNHIPILPERESIQIIDAMQKAFLNATGDFRRVDAYVGANTREVGLIGRTDLFEVFEALRDAGSPLPLLLQKNCFAFDDIIPDEDCYFYSLDDPSAHVVFEYPAKRIPGGIAGDRTNKPIGPYVIAGKALDWCIYVAGSADEGPKPAWLIICSGAKVLEKLEEQCANIETDQTFDDLRIFIKDKLTPWFAARGYAHSRAFGGVPVFRKAFAHHDAEVKFEIEKKQADEGAAAELRLTVCAPESLGLHEKFGHHPGSVVKPGVTDSKSAFGGSDILKLASHTQFGQFETDVFSYLQEHLPWAEQEYSQQDMIQLYLENDGPIDAAMICIAELNDRPMAAKILAEAIAAEDGWKAEHWSKTAREVLGIDIDADSPV